jgi:hypothetical protein
LDVSEVDRLVDSPGADQGTINLLWMVCGQDKKATRSVDYAIQNIQQTRQVKLVIATGLLEILRRQQS